MKRIIILTLALMFVLSFFSAANAACKCGADKVMTYHSCTGKTKDVSPHPISEYSEETCSPTIYISCTIAQCKMCRDKVLSNIHDCEEIHLYPCTIGSISNG